MARHSNAGRIFEVIEGPYKGKTAHSYHREQKEQFLLEGKLVVWVEQPNLFDGGGEGFSASVERIVIKASKLKLIGFFD